MVKMSDFLMPFLKDRCHGDPLSARRAWRIFFKNKPDYTPDFVSSVFDGSHEHIVCSSIPSLYGWLISWRLNFTFRFRKFILKVRNRH